MSQRLDNRDHDIDLAVACAGSFLALAESIVGSIPAIKEGEQAGVPGPHLGDLAACATNIAFAIELYLKAILHKCKVDPGREHKLGNIYKQLPQCFKVVIERSFEDRRKSDWNGRYPSISLAAHHRLVKLPAWDDSHAESFDLQALLDRSSDLFVSFRICLRSISIRMDCNTTASNTAFFSQRAGQFETPSTGSDLQQKWIR